jgi:acetyltransferase-like isoleucine patch superfamily enzyme
MSTDGLAQILQRAERHLKNGVGSFARQLTRYGISKAKVCTSLRTVQALGKGVRIAWRCPVVHNEGTIELGSRMLIDAPINPVYFGVEKGALLKIGDDAYVNDGVWFGVTQSVNIGARVKIGPGVRILDNHYHDVYARNQRPDAKPIVIEDDVWIAADSIILAGVTIGRGAIVGAHSLVTKNVEPFTVVGGNPAKLLRRLDATRLTST